MPRRKATASAAVSDSSTQVQVPKKSKVEPPCLQWEWENDGAVWTKYDKTHNDVLTDGYSDHKLIDLDIGSDGVVVNVEKLTQKNKRTGWTRRVRCAVQGDDTDFYVWSWKTARGKGKVNFYTASASVSLESAKVAEDGEVTFNIGAQTVTVDLEQMVQNVGPRKKEDVERIKSDAVDSVPITTTVKLESAGKSSKKSATVKSNADDESDDETIKEKKKGTKTKVEKKETAKSKSAAKSAASKSGDLENGTKGKSGVARVVVMNGKAPVDAECSTLADRVHVYCEGDDIWDCMLNQTNISNNNNKYYIIQLLEENSKPSYHVWQRWGRVGYKGQNNLVACGPDLTKAKNVFTKKFSDKTRNDWEFRKFFEKVPGKYDLLEMDYSAQDVDTVDAAQEKKPIKYPDCTLEAKLQKLLKLICDIKYMEQTVIEMEYDAQKAPLGKLTSTQIKAGYSALKKIADLVEKEDYGTKLTLACSEFYTCIPHNFGMRPPSTIRTTQEIKSKLQLLETLDDISVAVRTLKEGDTSQNPIDRHYLSLNCKLESMDRLHPDFKILEKYMRDTHAATHSHYTLDVVNIFSCDKSYERDNFKDYGNRVLLWHGSRLSNWVGILTKGLRIAPPEAPPTGYMFGKGVYFADMSSKSANYCFATPSKNVGLLLLCEVSLGKPNDLLAADYNAHRLPANTHSVKGLGKIVPDPATHVTLSDGVLVPVGKSTSTKINNPRGYTLNYNEYIVYDTKQIRMRYLMKVKFNFNH